MREAHPLTLIMLCAFGITNGTLGMNAAYSSSADESQQPDSSAESFRAIQSE